MSTSPARVRRHMLGVGPPPHYQFTKVIAKTAWDVEAPRLMRAWRLAVPNRPATASTEDVGVDYARLTIALD
jgi:hypothetical protein